MQDNALVEFVNKIRDVTLENLYPRPLPVDENQKPIPSLLLNPITREFIRADLLCIPKGRVRSVSNAEALFEVVEEEAKRLNNETGAQMTVIFTKDGGLFFPDDKNRDNPDIWKFERKPSREISALCKVLDKTMEHATFLRAMSSIRGMVVGFDEIYRAMKRVRINKGMEVVSAPRIENGQQKSEVVIGLRMEGETGAGAKMAFPSEFQVHLPIVSCSSQFYDFTVEVDVWQDDPKEPPQFELVAPERAAIVDKATLDEISHFKEAIQEILPEILVVTDL